jgi:hypothetical protein
MTFAFFCAVIFLITGCSETGKLKPAAVRKSGDANGGDDEDVDLDDISSGGGTVEDLIKKCGIDPAKLSDPNATLYQKDIKSYPKAFAGAQTAILINVVYKIEVTSILKIKSTPTSGRMETDFLIKAEPKLAEGPAEEQIAPLRGVTTSKSLTIEERGKVLADAVDWNGLTCTIQPTASAEVAKGDGHVKVNFKPALPGSVSPLGLAEVYAEELNGVKTFTDIEAEVTQSTNMNVSAHSKYKGTVTVKPVTPTLILNMAGKAGSQINADSAYRFTYEGFGGAKVMAALGIMPEVTYYIDHKKKDFVAIVAKTGDETAGDVVFLSELK